LGPGQPGAWLNSDYTGARLRRLSLSASEAQGWALADVEQATHVHDAQDISLPALRRRRG